MVLCRQYGVSRTVLREAVKMLTAKGLLRARPRQGTWVQPEVNWNFFDPDVLHWLLERKPWHELLLEFTQARLVIEPGAASLAARMASVAEKDAVQRAIDRMIAAERGDDDPLESDIAFHVAVLEATRNRFFIQLCEFIRTALRVSIRISNQRKGVSLASDTDHQRIADAILAGDAQMAATAMCALIQEVFRCSGISTARVTLVERT